MSKKILIVDDEPELVHEMKDYLESCHYELSTACNGREAFNKTKTEKPDLIILDVLMPQMTGYEFTHKLRDLVPEDHQIPIIVISGRPNMKQFFDASDIKSFLAKPFGLEALLGEVKRLLPSEESNHSQQKHPEKAQQSNTILVAGINDFTLKKIADDLTPLGFTVELVQDENRLLTRAAETKPRWVLCQFNEDADIWNAVFIQHELKKNAATAKIPLTVFCLSALAIDAAKDFSRERIFSYHETPELLDQIHQYLKQPCRNL